MPSSRAFAARLLVFLSLVFTFGISGCATTIKDYAQKPLISGDDDKQGVLFGHFDVVYNGQLNNSHCAVCFSGEESGCYKLPKSGNLILRASAGESHVHRISCLDSVENHVFPKDLSFRVLARQRNYLGYVTVDWTNPKPGFRFDKFFNLMGAVTDEKKPDGTATYAIADRMDEVLAQLDSLFKTGEELPINACILSQAE